MSPNFCLPGLEGYNPHNIVKVKSCNRMYDALFLSRPGNRYLTQHTAARGEMRNCEAEFLLQGVVKQNPLHVH